MSSKSSTTDTNAPVDIEEVLRLANIVYFRSHVYEKTRWMGVHTAKCPMDMWVYQELMFDLKTDLVIETGTLAGGSALFFAHMLDQMGRGKVITVDINEPANPPQHSRIDYVTGSSIDPVTLSRIEEDVARASSVLVILDSDHRAPFKLQELELYAPFVTKGSYIIAEDSCFDRYPAWPEFGPGPATAVKEFLKKDDRFDVDRSMERHLISFAPGAFLKRVR
jgi:cephalosporin hydroxylase